MKIVGAKKPDEPIPRSSCRTRMKIVTMRTIASVDRGDRIGSKISLAVSRYRLDGDWTTTGIGVWSGSASPGNRARFRTHRPAPTTGNLFDEAVDCVWTDSILLITSTDIAARRRRAI